MFPSLESRRLRDATLKSDVLICREYTMLDSAAWRSLAAFYLRRLMPFARSTLKPCWLAFVPDHDGEAGQRACPPGFGGPFELWFRAWDFVGP
ncbi:hypothetical protein ASE66_02400 [Bosea sp. Root483D1]|nr:hypothetical protein ASE66_02400 [Bosea sp. Root483D1]